MKSLDDFLLFGLGFLRYSFVRECFGCIGILICES